jgi:hypothetical protein
MTSHILLLIRGLFMNKPNTVAVFAASLVAFGALQTAFAGDMAPGTRAISAKEDSAELTVRVRQALSRYAAACANHDPEAIAGSLTSFAVIEYATATAGRFTAVDALAADTCWEGPLTPRSPSSDLPYRIYPTSEPNSVLLQYTLSVGSGVGAQSIQDLVLVEIDGGRIARIRDYAASAPRVTVE